jgi:hypothetical protein
MKIIKGLCKLLFIYLCACTVALYCCVALITMGNSASAQKAMRSKRGNVVKQARLP